MMQQFKAIPATELKIDRSFVREMISDDRDRILIQKTIEMGHDLGIQVMAEGVETQEQFDLLRANGCDRAQGYLFSRPIPAGGMVSWLKAYRDHLLPLDPHSIETEPLGLTRYFLSKPRFTLENRDLKSKSS
jgi:EAL domain-containing protein (putative c-di-GMP-specific phosphodiesterase class I)